MTRQQKAKHDLDCWADQVRQKCEALKVCIGSAPINPTWIEDVGNELDLLTTDTIKLGYLTAEGEMG